MLRRKEGGGYEAICVTFPEKEVRKKIAFLNFISCKDYGSTKLTQIRLSKSKKFMAFLPQAQPQSLSGSENEVSNKIKVEDLNNHNVVSEASLKDRLS